MFSITSTSSAKLEVGMTLNSITESGASDKVKTKQIALFNKYNTIHPDEKIDEQEFEAYEKDCTKQKWKTGLMIAGGIALLGLTAFALYKGYKHFKNPSESVNVLKDSVQVPKIPTQSKRLPMLENPQAGELWANGFHTNKEFFTIDGTSIPKGSVISSNAVTASSAKIIDEKLVLNVNVNGKNTGIVLDGIDFSQNRTFHDTVTGKSSIMIFESMGGPYNHNNHQLAQYLNAAI